MYLHNTLSDFVRAQEDPNRKIVPFWEDGSDVEIEPEQPGETELEEETEEEDSSSSGDSRQEQWTPGN